MAKLQQQRSTDSGHSAFRPGSTYRPTWAHRCSARREGEQLWQRLSWTRPLCPGAVCRVNTGRPCCLFPSWRWNRLATSSATPAGWIHTALLRRSNGATFKQNLLIHCEEKVNNRFRQVQSMEPSRFCTILLVRVWTHHIYLFLSIFVTFYTADRYWRSQKYQIYAAQNNTVVTVKMLFMYLAILKNCNVKLVWVILHLCCFLHNFIRLYLVLVPSVRNCKVSSDDNERKGMEFIRWVQTVAC